MKEKMEHLLYWILKHDASDVHFIKEASRLKVSFRTVDGMQEIHQNAFDIALFNYLKYISDMDLANSNLPQSGNFTYNYEEKRFYFRFSLLQTIDKETAVLRILNNHGDITLEKLTSIQSQYQSFLSWTKTRSGLVVLSGPTGSGKTTTLHAILSRIASLHHLKVVSLEDPIEIYDDSYLQLQINERNNFTYEEGIRQLMRHDPDVIMIGEIRDPNSAKMLLRSALSGHMIFTTIHAKCCSEAIKRLNEFGLSNEDLKHTLTAVCSQRLYGSKDKKGRVCIYEVLEKEDLQFYFHNQELPMEHKDIFAQIKEALQQQKISYEEAQYDLPD
ncbi:ATPase, T2SS/T4P/T4SS family [Amedibacillus sp. YH-ame6]